MRWRLNFFANILDINRYSVKDDFYDVRFVEICIKMQWISISFKKNLNTKKMTKFIQQSHAINNYHFIVVFHMDYQEVNNPRGIITLQQTSKNGMSLHRLYKSDSHNCNITIIAVSENETLSYNFSQPQAPVVSENKSHKSHRKKTKKFITFHLHPTSPKPPKPTRSRGMFM